MMTWQPGLSGQQFRVAVCFQDFHMEKCCKMSKAAVAPGNSIPKGFLSTDQASAQRSGHLWQLIQDTSGRAGAEALKSLKIAAVPWGLRG